jgi:hypothetical protein
MTTNNRQPSEPATERRYTGMDDRTENDPWDPMDGVLEIDNTGAASGNITEHFTRDERVTYPDVSRLINGRPIRTLCGRDLYQVQKACGNVPCRRCQQLVGRE